VSDPLYMIELRPDPAALIRFAKDQGINRHADEDLGYAAHAWLAAMFGRDVPKPFRLLQDRRLREPPRLLGFSRLSGDALAERAERWAGEEAERKREQFGRNSDEYMKAVASIRASALAIRVCSLQDGIRAKPMPHKWPAGRRLGFELLDCPISRVGGNEDDVYRRHRRECDASGEVPAERAEVYRGWLARQFGEAATLDDYSLDGFRTLRLLRKAGDAGRRDFLAPQASFSGVFRVKDGEAFQHLLARGVGRHRAFGFGMLLLRPAP